jgi:hypothetical protein
MNTPPPVGSEESSSEKPSYIFARVKESDVGGRHFRVTTKIVTIGQEGQEPTVIQFRIVHVDSTFTKTMRLLFYPKAKKQYAVSPEEIHEIKTVASNSQWIDKRTKAKIERIADRALAKDTANQSTKSKVRTFGGLWS